MPDIVVDETVVYVVVAGGTGADGTSITDADYIQFNPSLAAVPDYSEGMLFVHPDQKTLSYFGQFEGPILNIGEEMWAVGRNTTGSTIADGKVTYVAGASGNRPLFDLALADSLATSLVIGVSTMDIANNSEGISNSFGLLRDINSTGSGVSETWVNGQVLYVHPTVAGEMTNVKPISPNLIIPIALVLNAHITQGLLFVRSHFPVNLAAGSADGQVQFRNGEVLDADSSLTFDKATGVLTTNNFTETIVAHGTISTGTEDFDASAGGGHTINPTGNVTFSYSGFSASKLGHMAIEVTVENGDAPIIDTPAGFAIRSGSLDSLADGVTLVEVFSFNGTSGYQMVTNP